MKVGDMVHSKNGIEFSCEITKIQGSKITLTYTDYYEEEAIVNKSDLTKISDDEYDMPNWTVNFTQITG